MQPSVLGNPFLNLHRSLVPNFSDIYFLDTRASWLFNSFETQVFLVALLDRFAVPRVPTSPTPSLNTDKDDGSIRPPSYTAVEPRPHFRSVVSLSLSLSACPKLPPKWSPTIDRWACESTIAVGSVFGSCCEFVWEISRAHSLAGVFCERERYANVCVVVCGDRDRRALHFGNLLCILISVLSHFVGGFLSPYSVFFVSLGWIRSSLKKKQMIAHSTSSRSVQR